jgi:hypothetical protein
MLLDVRLNVPHAQRRLLSNKTLIKCMSARVAQRTNDYPRGTNRLASTCERYVQRQKFQYKRLYVFQVYPSICRVSRTLFFLQCLSPKHKLFTQLH